MGADLIFSENRCDLSGLSKSDLFVSKIIHQAFIEVDERGTKAAAATISLLKLKCSQKKEDPFEFKCDRPFLFFIHTNNGILFIGKHVQPSN
jgi:serpin B